MIRWIAILASVLGAAGVGLGAYAAHGLQDDLALQGLSPEMVAKKMSTCDIAVRYHLVHAVSLLALAAAPPTFAPKTRGLASLFFVAGIGLFCGVLYAQSIGGLVGLNLVVPLGGLSFMLGWLTIAVAALVGRQPRYEMSDERRNSGNPTQR